MISIIIPMYNAQHTIQRCLQSVMNQTYQDIEIIVVDDGSRDGCQNTVKELAEDDPRIRYCRKENGGVSRARNHGISVSQGEYICFIDSDDEVVPEYIESLYQAICAGNSDVAFCGYVEVAKNTRMNYILSAEEEKKLTGDIRSDFCILRLFAGSPWMKIYHADIIRDYRLRFRENMVTAEDQVFNFQYYEHCRSIAFVNKPLYIYYRAESELSKRSNVKCFNNEMEKIEYGIQFLKKQGYSRWEQIIALSVCYAVRRYTFLTDAGNSVAECCSRLKRMNLVDARIRLPLWQNNVIYQLLIRKRYFLLYCYLILRRIMQKE